MGSGVSRQRRRRRNSNSQQRKQSTSSQSAQPFTDRQWPYLTRYYLIHLIGGMVIEGEVCSAMEKVGKLCKLYGIGEGVDPDALLTEEDTPTEEFVLDKLATILTANIVALLTNKPEDWKDQISMMCDELSANVTPPSFRGSFPLHDIPIRELVLTGVDLYKTITKISTVRGILDKNPSITKLEMSYTGMTNDNFKVVLPSVSNLDCLTYLGLQGNRLEKSIITEMSLIMQNRQKFKSLKWVDLRNNVNIFTVPWSFLELLEVRWDTGNSGYTPSFRELAEGSILVFDNRMVPNI